MTRFKKISSIRKRVVFGKPASILSFLILIIFVIDRTNASIIVPKIDGDSQSVTRVFESLAANFGERFLYGKKYVAHLQLPQGHDVDPYLCGSLNHKKHYHSHPHTIDLKSMTESMEKQRQVSFDSFFNMADTFGTVSSRDENVVQPTDNIPVAILVKRGNCSFEEKAKNAMALEPKGIVKYVIVYDNKTENKLVSMSSDSLSNYEDIEVGLVFVSLETGKEFLRMVYEQPVTIKDEGGRKLFIDSENRWHNPFYDNQKDGMIATLSGFLIFIFCCGISLICVQAGFIHVENGFIFVGNMPPEGWNPNGVNDESQAGRLLTTEEANAFPRVIYHESYKDNDNEEEQKNNVSSGPDQSTEFNNHSCAVCLEDYLPGEDLLVLPCKHSFHSSCIIPWVTERSPTCPLCKLNLLSDPVEEVDDSEDTEASPSDVAPATRDLEEHDDFSVESQRGSSSRRSWWRQFFPSNTSGDVAEGTNITPEGSVSSEMNEPLLRDEDV